LTGFTREDRFSVTARLSAAVNGAGGWILDHHQFSNVALCINFEIERADLRRLDAALGETGLTFASESKDALSDLAATPGTGSVIASIHAVFVHDEPGIRVAGPLG
jgi:hypothetical protein